MRQTADAFMFGSSFLVFPVLKFGETMHDCYLPQENSSDDAGGERDYVDFWTGTVHKAGLTVSMPVTLDHLPLCATTWLRISVPKLPKLVIC